jgi:hypothetical protein
MEIREESFEDAAVRDPRIAEILERARAAGAEMITRVVTEVQPPRNGAGELCYARVDGLTAQDP